MLVSVLKAVSEKNRLFILASCSQDEYYTCQLVRALRLSQSTVSNHIKILKESRLLKSHQYRTWSGYYLNPSLSEEIRGVVQKILPLVYKEKEWQQFHERLQKAKDDLDICP
jgi:ArsR family transcriptional regulator